MQWIIYQFVITQLRVIDAVYWNECNYPSDDESNKLCLLWDSDYFRVGILSDAGGKIC